LLVRLLVACDHTTFTVTLSPEVEERASDSLMDLVMEAVTVLAQLRSSNRESRSLMAATIFSKAARGWEQPNKTYRVAGSWISHLYRLYPPFLWLQDIMRGEKILQAAPCCDRRLLNPLSDAVLQQRLLQ